MLKELITVGAISLGGTIGISCGSEESVKDVKLPAKEASDPSVDKYRGDNFEITRIGENIFKVSGKNLDDGSRYLSLECEVIGVGAREIGHTLVRQLAVTVADDNCLPDLK